MLLFVLSDHLKAKASAAYNQTVTANIISIVKHGRLPDDSKCEVFLEEKRIPGGNREGFPDLPEGEHVKILSVIK